MTTNTKGGDTPRREHDDYFTPDPLALAIAGAVRDRFGLFHVVVEPSAGGGAFVRAARAVWPRAKIIALEPNGPWARPYAEGMLRTPLHDAGADEVLRLRWEQFDGIPRDLTDRLLILGNPPFDLPEDRARRNKAGNDRSEIPVTAERHVLLGLQRLQPDDVLTFLTRQSFATTAPRVRRIWRPTKLTCRWDIAPRPSYTGGKSDGAEYNALAWRVGHQGPYEGDWIYRDRSWDKP